jgi:hypothetical protein
MGCIRVNVGADCMVKTALLVSATRLSTVLRMRTFAAFVATPGTVQLYGLPPAGVLAIIVLQLPPLLVVYCSCTFTILALVHVIAFVLPKTNTSPPTGDVSVTLGATLIVKTALLESLTVLSDTSLTFTRLVTLAVLGTVQGNIAGLDGTLGVITDQLVPPLVLYSSFTLLTLALLQVMFWLLPIFHTSVPLGEFTVIDGITILNTPLILCNVVSDALRMRTLAFALAVFGTLQLNVPPEAATLLLTRSQFVPPLIL